ncbi:MAG: hypothetical protein UX10_C0008G0013 [Candidatus Magasanikbacteria bacterium GW2011_GWA2_45_39]|uniref:LamG-like jellyroll fold domain-containing protein n=2 Tax=Candidatus Magasanikiibacteriota TaxID=1752731 RepID=A0A0G1Q937_9BACT|nr:MAG: hypothetical protein UX10_C0008G0013 [Candidatus Magasanikbacteria bacterium GW2011_GWA2_45_39]KKU14228.1 MAG: hypothetical protein UX20_C0003G0009 [Candidatus Magasanikbacteria bacterium GW2011_GWC2_45_8]
MTRAKYTIRWMKFLVLVSVAVFLLTAFAPVAYAQNFAPTQVGSNTDALGVGGIGASTGLVDTDPRIIAAKIIRIALGLLGVIVIGLMIYAGYLWMTAGGDEEKVATAKKVLRNAVIGLAIILSSVAITQFIISKLTSAIMGAPQKQGGGGCVGDECLKPEFSVFYATTTPQSPPQLPIKNVVISIDFFNGLGAPAVLDQSTVSVDSGKTILDGAITIVKKGAIDAKGVLTPVPADSPTDPFAGELKFVDQNTVEFHPIGSCADAENPLNSSSNTDCFEKNTVYQVTLKNSIASKSGKALDCSAVHPCVSQFITGEKYDAEPPKISLVQPGNNALVGNSLPTLMSAEVSDDAGVKKVAFYENENSNIVDKILNPFLVSGLVSDQTWKPKLKDPNKAEVVQLTAKAYDIDNHETLSEPQTIKILPAWCFNNTLDEDKGEGKASTVIGAPDCGQNSECGSCQGEGCDTDLECAAGICIPQPGVKVSLTAQNTKYKAEASGLPPFNKIIPYYEWYIDGTPLTVAYLPFDKTSDTSKFTSNLSVPSDALNASQVAHAIVSGPDWKNNEGVIGAAYQFKSPTDYIETNVLPWKGNQLSLQWWMKRSNLVVPKLFMIAQIKDSLSVQTNASGNVTVSVKAGDAGNISLAEKGNWPLPKADDAWHQVTVVFDGSSILYYVDGVQDTASVAFAHTVNATNNPLVIGYKGNKGTIAFDGLIDEVRIFTRILNAQQLQTEFKSATETQMPADTLDVNVAPAKTIITADIWQLSKAGYEITNTKAPYREKKGICVNVPKITNVIQTSGAEDNYVTVVGQSFGAYKQGVSSVSFSKVASPQPAKADQWVGADLCSVKAWHDNYVVVKVPKGAVTGPIKIDAQSSSLQGYENLVFRDTSADAFGPVFNPSEVFKVTNEKFPGLCTVDPENVSAGDIMKLTGTQLVDGKSPGDAILLGVENEALNEFGAWSNFLILDIKVPVTIAAGQTSVKVQSRGMKSNTLPLGVFSTAGDTNPHIFSMNPTEGPIGTYVTLTGINFGTNGEVVFSQGGDTFVADLPPAYCGSTWTTGQIVVKVPQKIQQNKGDYSVSVVIKKGSANAASNKKIFTVNADSLKPGLCKLDPDNGPLFSAQFGGIAFKGEGFGDAPGSIKFTKDAQVSDQKFFAWGDTLIDTRKFSDIEKSAQAQFKTGPANVLNAQKLPSNSLQFKIQNCKEELQKGKELAAVCGEGNSCCASGVCQVKGQCPEDKKPGASVYMWSFTTGKLPIVPKVLEQCGAFCTKSGKSCSKIGTTDGCDKKIDNDICKLVTPSPSPSKVWEGAANICVNAVVKVRFDTSVDIEEKSTQQAIILYECQDKTTCILEDTKQIVPVSYSLGGWSSGGKGGTKVTMSPLDDLAPDKPYGVLVTTKVKSLPGALSEAMIENATCPAISKNVKINGISNLKAAYCTTFVTRPTKDYCELGAVVVDPVDSSVFDFNKQFKDFYSVTPIAKGDVCAALDGDDYDWTWSPTDKPSVAQFQKTSDYADISNNAGDKGFVKSNQDLNTKNKETPFDTPEQIVATWVDKVLNPAGLIKGTAQLTIKLPNPKVVSYYPQCTTACVNAEVGAEFNVVLGPSTVNKNTVRLYKCALFDVTCKQYVLVDGWSDAVSPYTVSLNTDETDREKVNRQISLKHTVAFVQNTYYKIKIQGDIDGVKSIWQIQLDSAALNDDCDDNGKNCKTFSWVFRTKNDGTACAVDKVILNPNTAVVKVVGGQATYNALAIGSPDACNPNGQILDTSGASYSWNWSPPEKPDWKEKTDDRAVVWMSNFSSGKQDAPWCTESCLKAGSASAPETGLCGNGKVESGEECDPAGDNGNKGGNNNIEKCGWNCLLYIPSTEGTPACNAATIQNGNCCGNGPQVLPEAGEECDLGLLNGVTGSGCESSCTKEGTIVSYVACVETDTQKGMNVPADVCAKGEAQYTHKGQVISVKVHPVCGNGKEEPGEECDKGNQNGAANSNCSGSCLLQLVSVSKCGNGIVEKDNGEQCDPKDIAGGKGCSDTCQNLGSSPLFGSWCGDSVVGTGETCDSSSKNFSLNVDAAQYATAVGAGTIIEKKQTASISATISQAGQPSKKGIGTFELQCGFGPINSACPDASNTTNGAGTDSCCYQRPVVTIDQPKTNSSSVCPNAVFEVTMKNGEADKEALLNNIILAEQVVDDGTPNCPNGTTPFTYETKTFAPKNLWQKIIALVKRFLSIPVYAEQYKYCAGDAVISASSTYDNSTNTSVISVTPQIPLKQKKNYKLFVLNYDKAKGWSGLKDTHGVTFVDSNNFQKNISSEFTTLDVPFCKVTDVSVIPNYHLFNKKDATKEFVVIPVFIPAGIGVEGMQQIAPIPGQYEWSYVWNTNDSSVASVADAPFKGNNTVKAVGKNGNATITSGIKITKDTSAPSTKDQEITGEAQAQVFLCENPWPNITEYKDPTTGKMYGFGLIDAETFPPSVAAQGKAWNNFQTMYCKDAGISGFEDDLPALKQPAVLYHQDQVAPPSPADPILKEFFFTFEEASGNKDSLGLRVYPNIEHKTLKEWYQGQPWVPKGNPVPIKIGQYEALQEGRTYYIAGLNLGSSTLGESFYVQYYAGALKFYKVDLSCKSGNLCTISPVQDISGGLSFNPQTGQVVYKGSSFTEETIIKDLKGNQLKNLYHIKVPPAPAPAYTNVYVWSFSDNASADTVNIFNQLLANFTLNINIDNPRVCSADPSISCSKNLDCGAAGGECEAPLDKMNRDLKRIKDLALLANKIELYKILNQSYPNLKNNPSLGTFIPGLTNSKWLSWQGVLGNALGVAVPLDPINTFNGCGGGDANITSGGTTYNLKDFDAQTCWNGQISTFMCPKGSFIYQYEFASNSKASIRANFEIPSVKWNKPLEDFVGNSSLLDLNNSCKDQVIGLSEKCGDGVVGNGEQCEIGQVKEGVCNGGNTQTFGVNNYSVTNFFPCSDTCTWSADALPLSKLKLCSNNSNPDAPIACAQDADCSAVVPLPGPSSTCQSVLNFCAVTGKLCVTKKDCNQADVKDICNSFKASGLTCVPHGYCGNGKIEGSEVCDDGANNGKYGYCSFSCKTTGGAGYCGDGKLKLNAKNEPADPNKVCDASALWFGGNSSGWSYITDTQKTETYKDGKLKYFQQGWQTNNNLISCSEQENPDKCLWQGAKYNTDKLQSCSWDCQSYDYCGDGKVNSTLNSKGKPYEECEKSEACQVGYCTYKNGTKLMKSNAGVLCEDDAGCAPLALKIVPPFCDNKKCSSYSSNAGESCVTNGDCVQQFTCQGFVSGKRYCQMKSEFTPKPDNSNTPKKFSDDAVKFGLNSCVWDSKIIAGTTVTCLPLNATPVQASVGVCGDGIIQDGKKGADGNLLPGHGEVSMVVGAVPEVCDKGKVNGVIPFAEYGKTANYCAFGCGQVITVSGGFCGDKNVSAPEYCDASAAQSDYVCSGSITECNPNNTSSCSPSAECVPSARWSAGAKNSCDAKATGSTVPAGSFLTNCTNTCIGSCKVSVCGDKIIDPGEECDDGDPKTFKDGTNGVAPILSYNTAKQTKSYCTNSCLSGEVTNTFCGDKKITIPNEWCDANLFSPAATASCLKGKLSSCTNLCDNKYVCDNNAESAIIVTVQVLNTITDQYDPGSNGGKEFSLYWNDSEMTGNPIAFLDFSNNYKITLSALTGGAYGNLTIKYKKGPAEFGEVQVLVSSGFPSLENIETSNDNTNWKGSTIDNYTQNIFFQSVDSFVKINNIKL